MPAPHPRRALLAASLCALGCRVDLESLTNHSGGGAEGAPALQVAPPASPPEGEPLYQVLYQDEFGEPARPLGQRARMLGWMRGLELSREQLAGLNALVRELAEERRASALVAEAAGAAEAELYGPVYERIILQFAGEDPWDEAALGALAGQLREAQLAVGARYDPHAASLDALNRQLSHVERWLDTLSGPQRLRAAEGRFFLRKRLSPLARPGDYEAIVGTLWEAEDFDSLRYTERAEGDPAMNVGGLWRSEPMRTGPGKYLSETQLKAVVYLALTEPGVLEATEVLLGQREPLDFSPAAPLTEAPAAGSPPPP